MTNKIFFFANLQSTLNYIAIFFFKKKQERNYYRNLTKKNTITYFFVLFVFRYINLDFFYEKNNNWKQIKVNFFFVLFNHFGQLSCVFDVCIEFQNRVEQTADRLEISQKNK